MKRNTYLSVPPKTPGTLSPCFAAAHEGVLIGGPNLASGTSTSTHTSGPRGCCRLSVVQVPSSCGQPVPHAHGIGTYHLTNGHGRHLHIPYTHTHSVAHMSEMAIHIFKTGHTHNCPQPVHTQTHLSSMHTVRMHTASHSVCSTECMHTPAHSHRDVLGL